MLLVMVAHDRNNTELMWNGCERTHLKVLRELPNAVSHSYTNLTFVEKYFKTIQFLWNYNCLESDLIFLERLGSNIFDFAAIFLTSILLRLTKSSYFVVAHFMLPKTWNEEEFAASKSVRIITASMRTPHKLFGRCIAV